jgi:hypothetical protein
LASPGFFPLQDGRWVRHCDTCGQTDAHPRCIYLGSTLNVTYRHMDCCAAAGCPGDICGTVLRASRKAHGDALVSWLEGRMAALGGEMTAWLKAGAPIMGGASGLDQARVLDFLQVVTGYSANASSPYTAILANPFSASSSQLGHIRLISTATPSGSNANGSEISGGSYVQGTGINYTTGSGGAFSNPAYTGGSSGSTGSGSTSSNTNLQQTGMPTVVVGGMEIWDSKGTSPAYAASLRWMWCQLQSAISCTSGDTFVFSSGAIVATMAA